MRYRFNPNCSCPRCRTHGYMGPTVLITIGVLFLLDQVGHSRWTDFGSTWPALLIVIGLVMFLQHNASPEGHVPRGYEGMPQGYPVQPVAPRGPVPTQSPIVTPQPVPPAGSLTAGQAMNRVDDPEVHNG